MKLMHRALAGLSTAVLLVSPALAQQGFASHDPGVHVDAGPQATVFLRIPFGGQTTEQAPRFGFSFASGCFGSAGFSSQANLDACDAKPFRSIEISSGFDDAPWSLSFGGAVWRSEILSWKPRTGALSLAGDDGWLWIGLGALAVVGVAAALSSDDEPTLCTGNTIPNPISGECEPLVLN